MRKNTSTRPLCHAAGTVVARLSLRLEAPLAASSPTTSPRVPAPPASPCAISSLPAPPRHHPLGRRHRRRHPAPHRHPRAVTRDQARPASHRPGGSRAAPPVSPRCVDHGISRSSAARRDRGVTAAADRRSDRSSSRRPPTAHPLRSRRHGTRAGLGQLRGMDHRARGACESCGLPDTRLRSDSGTPYQRGRRVPSPWHRCCRIDDHIIGKQPHGADDQTLDRAAGSA
jgi:hypothetical protein